MTEESTMDWLFGTNRKWRWTEIWIFVFIMSGAFYFPFAALSLSVNFLNDYAVSNFDYVFYYLSLIVTFISVITGIVAYKTDRKNQQTTK